MAKPFVGLTPFTETDAAYFFGREAERRVLVDNLLATRLTLLYGESGAGKSSLLNAGVAFDLRGEPEFAVTVFRNWRDDPVLALPEAIRKSTGSATPEVAAARLVDVIRECASDKRTLLIILDQFEEYFHYHASGREFDAELAQVLGSQDVPAHFLISVREDWLAALDRFKGRIPGLFDNYLRMQHLSRKGAAEAIEGPLRQFNGEQQNGNRISWDEGLAPRVIESILSSQSTLERGLQSDDRVQAPYLQMVMSALWQRDVELGSRRLRSETLDDLGGARRIYEGHLSDTLSKALSDEERGAAAGMFRLLVTGTGRKQNQTVRELAGSTGLAEALVRSTVTKLRDARVLTQTPPPRGTVDDAGYEFAHDVLAEGGLRYARQEILQRERRKAEEAEHRAAAEARAARRLRMLLAALGVALLLAFGGAVMAWRQTRLAETQSGKAERNATLALAREVIQSAHAVSLQRKADLAVLLASQAAQMARALNPAVADEATAVLRAALISVDPLTVPGFDGHLTGLAWAPDGERFVTVDKGLRIFDGRTGKLLVSEKADVNSATSAIWSPDGKWLATVGHRSGALRDGSSWKKLKDLPGAIFSIAWHPKLPQLASSSSAHDLLIWSIPDGKKIASWKAHDHDIDQIAWSPDGGRIATASEDGRLRIWDASSHRRLLDISAFNIRDDSHPSVVWSPDGKLLATADLGRRLELRDAATGTSVATTLQTGLLPFAAWSGDGRWLAVASISRNWTVLDGKTGQPYLEIPSDNAANIAWNQQGRLLALLTLPEIAEIEKVTASVQVYQTDALQTQSLDELFALARARVKRSLTPEECTRYLHANGCPARP